ncbi:hypothetical protein P879_11877 [Paragonimus westermani]|uniref:Uncharacterized protein n=1 Tax=Paragonimus westermani TaxID=34504 RepID=A0A8T0D4U5_9TREM|nr:hypothetical protein P879_11877 [Paragonimus westermani]
MCGLPWAIHNTAAASSPSSALKLNERNTGRTHASATILRGLMQCIVTLQMLVLFRPSKYASLIMDVSEVGVGEISFHSCVHFQAAEQAEIVVFPGVQGSLKGRMDCLEVKRIHFRVLVSRP